MNNHNKEEENLISFDDLQKNPEEENLEEENLGEENLEEENLEEENLQKNPEEENLEKENLQKDLEDVLPNIESPKRCCSGVPTLQAGINACSELQTIAQPSFQFQGSQNSTSYQYPDQNFIVQHDTDKNVEFFQKVGMQQQSQNLIPLMNANPDIEMELQSSVIDDHHIENGSLFRGNYGPTNHDHCIEQQPYPINLLGGKIPRAMIYKQGSESEKLRMRHPDEYEQPYKDLPVYKMFGDNGKDQKIFRELGKRFNNDFKKIVEKRFQFGRDQKRNLGLAVWFFHKRFNYLQTWLQQQKIDLFS